VISEALDEVDSNHDGFLEYRDIPTLLSAMQVKPLPVLVKYYWEKYNTDNRIGLEAFKELVADINPNVGESIRDAKSG